jgi:Uma2 family endonuclease
MAIKIANDASVDATSEQYWPPPQGKWTYDDYARLPDHGVRYEVIEGELVMTPAPRPKHQKVSLNLTFVLEQFVRSRQLGEVYVAPIDVNLPGLASPVQPDLLFITTDRLDIIKEKFIEGAPDLIIEVLSAGSEMDDRRTKFELYARAGVREYWLVDPDGRTIEIFVLRGQAYAPLGNFDSDGQTRSEVLPDFTVTVGEICPA